MAENKVKAASKGTIYQDLATEAGITRKQVAAVFDGLSAIIKRELGKKGPGVFTLPSLLKLKLVKKPATKARKGKNPFTGEEMMYKAKPARNAVKALPLKSLKEMIK